MEQCRAKQGVAATSRRHHIPTSSQQCRSKQFSNIATSQRRDVSTSRRLNVATSQRRDVSSKICISSFNVRTARKLGYREAYEERHGFLEPELYRLRESARDLYRFSFFWIALDIMMMFLILDILFFSFMMF